MIKRLDSAVFREMIKTGPLPMRSVYAYGEPVLKVPIDPPILPKDRT